MNSTKSCICVCCNNRVSAAERRRVTSNCLRLFVATRLFPTCLPNDGFICNKCRLMYKKWKLLSEFRDMMAVIDGYHAASTVSDGFDGEVEMGNERIDDKSNGNDRNDDTSNDEEFMDLDATCNDSMDTSSSDTQSVTDIAGEERMTEDIGMKSDEDKK